MPKLTNRLLYCPTLNTIFDGPQQAAQWLRDHGYPKAHDKTIVWAVTGRQLTAYGHVWRWADYAGCRRVEYGKTPKAKDDAWVLPLFKEE